MKHHQSSEYRQLSSAQALPSSKQFTFVNDDLFSVCQPSAERKRAIRCHVMADIHRSRRVWSSHSRNRSSEFQKYIDLQGEQLESDSEAHKTFDKVGKDQIIDHNQVVVVTGCATTQLLTPPDSPLETLVQDISDPCQLLSLPLCKPHVRYLQHFFQLVLPQRNPFKQHTWQIYSSMVSDTAVLCSMLAKAILHRGMITAFSNESTSEDRASFNVYKTEALKYKLASVQLISQKIKSKQALEDTTMLAILDLVCCYTSINDQDEVIPHIKGLDKLVNMRGGLLKLSPFLAYRVILSDNVIAAMTGTQPIIDISACIDSTQVELMTRILSSLSSLDITTTFKLLNEAFAQEDFTQKLCPFVLLIERQLLQQLEQEDSDHTNTQPEKSPIYQNYVEALMWAVVIYIELNLVNSWSFSAVISRLIRNLKAVLQGTSLELCWMPYTDALLVTLLLGGVGAAGRPERPWFIQCLAKLAVAMDLQTFENVKQVIRIRGELVGDTEGSMEQLWQSVELR